MKIRTALIAVVLCLACGFAAGAPLPHGGKKRAARAAGPGRHSPNWLMDGGDNQRSGWQKNETVLTKQNVKNLTLLWKIQTGNKPRALQSLMAPLVVENVPTSEGPKELVLVVGSSDNLYAIDAAAGKILWQRHFTYPPPAFGGRGLPPGESLAHLNFLNPGGTTDTPAVGPADASGHRKLYIIDGGGQLHTIDVSTGKDVKPIVQTSGSKFSLQLYKNQIIFLDYHGRRGVMSVNIDAADPKVMGTVGFGGGGGLWPRRGPAIDSNGTVWTTVGDGTYNPSDPNHLILGDSVIGFAQQPDGQWRVKNWFTPDSWAWLQKRDLDWNNTPTIFTYRGRELMAASGKECRVYLLDPNDPGGPNHDVPLYKTPLFCNQTADFQNQGSWGALDSWVDSNGTRWVVAPFWGPVATDIKFAITHSPIPTEGGEAAFKLTETDGKFALEPAWLSRDMDRGQPPIIANGMVFAYGSGESTQQAWPDIGLNFDSTIRAAHSTHATIYVLDGETGKVLWSSGDQIKSFTHFSGLAVANGKVYIGTYDGNFYCFGLPSEKTASR
jgi:outer membrane protein assembly factor BamB